MQMSSFKVPPRTCLLCALRADAQAVCPWREGENVVPGACEINVPSVVSPKKTFSFGSLPRTAGAGAALRQESELG